MVAWYDMVKDVGTLRTPLLSLLAVLIKGHSGMVFLYKCFLGEFSSMKYQGIVGCTPTNVPLWEIPI